MASWITIRRRALSRYASRCGRLLALALVVSGLPGLAVEPEAPLEWEAKTDGVLGKSLFSFWIPQKESLPLAVVVLLPGLQGDGRGMVKDPAWQNLARKYRLALLGCYLTNGRTIYYQVAKGDQGRVLFDALRTFGGLIGQAAGLEKRPLLIWGISAGGQYAYNFACLHPEAVMAFVVNKGGYYDDVGKQGVLKIPAIFFFGETDQDFRIQAITSRFAIGRRLGAPWCLVREPNIGHAIGASGRISVEFFDAVLSASASAKEAKPPVGDSFWLGDLKTQEIFPSDSSRARQERELTSWLPSRRFAEIWQETVTGKPR